MNILLSIISDPKKMQSISVKEWDSAIRFARHAKLLGYLQMLVVRHNLEGKIPQKVLEIFEGARLFNSYYRLRAKRELREIALLFRDKGFPIILLKGAAYIEARISPYQGRRLSDVDLLVAEKDLNEAEELFLSAGYKYGDVTEYDQAYYREWMHEIPPLVHPKRGFEVDLHRNLVPPVSRIKTDAAKLLSHAVPIKDSFFSILEPKDMLLHSATHLFFNDELRGGLRDLVDMHEICTNYSEKSDFWPQLVTRACELEMQRPLYYALSSLRRLLNTKIPDNVMSDISQYRPDFLTNYIMSLLIDKLLAPENVLHMQAPIAQWLLFVRSHWIRMPTMMLIKHLLYKSKMNFSKGTVK